MRLFALLLLLAGVAPSALAADRVTVEQMERVLLANRGRPDASVAEKLSGLELTERVSSARLLRWETDFSGSHTREALIGLADASVFLDLPAAEIPAVAAPDLKSQELMLSQAIDYVSKTIPRLPNFLATRETTQFEDATPEQLPSAQYASNIPQQLARSISHSSSAAQFESQPLHVVGRSSVAVTYRDGHEVDARTVKGMGSNVPASGLTTRGEFGPILGLVLGDAVRSHMIWGHWEQGVAGREAVFRYWVPQEKSHYMVAFPGKTGAEQQFPAYHGEIAVDPANGSILRLTVVSDVKPPDQMVTADIMVEYGPVVIGGSFYICPVKGVAVSRVPISDDTGKLQISTPLRTQVNDVLFAQYHVFRAKSRIVAADNTEPDATPADTVAAAGLPVPASVAAGQDQVSPAAQSTAISTASNSAPEASVSPAADTANEQAQVTPAAMLGSAPVAGPVSTAAAAPEAGPMVLHTKAELVLVDTVVTDHNKAVHGLNREKFHVFEDEREQTIRSFEEHQPVVAPAALAGPTTLPPHTYTNVPVYPETSAVNVLLLDGLNTPQTDQMNVRRQMIESLGKIKPGTSLAIFTLSSRLQLVKGFTTDVAQLREALQSVKAGSQSSVVLNAEGGSSMATAAVRLANSANGDPVTLAAAASMAEMASKTNVYATDERVRMTLDAMQQLARYLSGVPGRKNLIWFSGSFPIALGPDNMQHNYAEDVRKTSRLLLAARVAVYPVDARGLREMPSADASYVASANMTKSDASSFVNQTTVEQNSMTQIAEQTGGQAYVNTNGLKESVERIVENGSSYYTLAYVPSNKKADGKFRTVRLRLDHADYKLSYRPGYYADTPDSSAAHSAGGSSGIMAATLLGAPAATQILFQARVLAATDPMLQGVKFEDGAAGEMTAALKGPVRRYIVDLMVDPRSLLFEEMPDGARRTDIEFAVVAYDAESRRVNYLDRGSRVSLNAEQYSRMMAAGVPVRLALDVPVGQIALRVVVYDPATRRAGSLEVPVIVAAK